MAITRHMTNEDQGVFEAEATKAMSVAFKEVCKALEIPDTATHAREVIAKRILEAARNGASSPEDLRDTVLAASTPSGLTSGC